MMPSAEIMEAEAQNAIIGLYKDRLNQRISEYFTRPVPADYARKIVQGAAYKLEIDRYNLYGFRVAIEVNVTGGS